MSVFANIHSAARKFILELPLVRQTRKMYWTVHRNNRLLEVINANIQFLADSPQVTLTKNILNIMADEYVSKHLHNNLRHSEPGRLSRYERQIFSQSGEDGIIEEIFARIGTTNQFFVEFGVGNGLENNSVYLLAKGWRGYWIDANPEWIPNIEEDFRALLATKQLLVQQAFITAENIESLFQWANVPDEFDLLCIDIDGNDYWVWKAIASYRPRVVVIEYNALFGPGVRWARQYDPAATWNRTSYYGASLKSLEVLGNDKGYHLVGCNFAGVNAFFVRQDLISDAFCAPFTAENHYEPTRHHLIRSIGHRRGFGDFVRP